MAARSGSVGGMLYSLIIFVFLFVICLALTILFYTRAEEQRQLTIAAEEAAKTLRSRVEAETEDYKTLLAQAQESDRSLYGEMIVQRQRIHRLVTGNGQNSVDQVAQALKAIGVIDGENTAIGVVQDARGKAAAARDELAKTQAIIKQLGDRLDESKARYDAITAAHQEELANRKAVIDQLQQRLTQYEQSSDAERQQVVDQLTKAREQATLDLQAKEAELRSRDAVIAQKDVRIRELVAALRDLMPTSPDPTLEPDGKIIGVSPEDNMVYINLGEKDRVILGMNFEVYDARTGPQLEEVRPGEIATRLKRGKATLEVIRIDDNTCTCRIIRRGYGQRVAVGDTIANLAYDKKRVYKFFIYGDFDLNYDGKSEPGDFDLIVSLVKQWGGKVYEGDKMPLDTDFLVLGMEPQLPKASGETFDPEKVREAEQKRAAWEKYQRVGTQASELSVPVLNQNRFMTLMGYFRR